VFCSDVDRIIVYFLCDVPLMLVALLQMSLLIACGTAWGKYAPAHISPLAHRRALTDLVFYLLLPALVLDVIWRAPLDQSSLFISFLAACGVASGLAFVWFILRYVDCSPRQKGVLLLASAFPNATYLGLPVLNQVMGPATRATVLQYDLFACTPILLSFGMLIARYYGDSQTDVHPLKELSKVPPLWAVAIGVSLNVSGLVQPLFIHTVLSTLAGGVVPLMLIVLGMSIRWQSLHFRFMPLLLPVVITSLLLIPLVVLLLSHLLSLPPSLIQQVVIVAAMPTMVFGVVISERYQLDTELYAAAVTITTLLSLGTLPLWFYYLSS
jgi:predicted permease